MKIGIISDTHDQLDNIDRALEAFRIAKVERILHLGDWCSPFSLRRVASANIPTDGIFGNNDGDIFKLNRACPEHVKLHDRFALLSIDGLSICLFHGDPEEVVEALAHSGRYDVVLYGHNHVRQVRSIEQTLIINPGSCVGSQTPVSPVWTPPSCCVFDTITKEVELIELEPTA